jgi:hypothetical protein
LFSHIANGVPYVSKWLVEARGPERKDYRVSIVMLACAGANNASIRYLRGLASDEVGRPVIVTFAIGKQDARIALNGAGTRRDALDTGAQFSSGSASVPFDEVEAAASSGAIGVTESAVDRDPVQVNGIKLSTLKLSTLGLAEGIKLVRGKCVPSVQAVPWAGATAVPFTPTDAKLQTPYKPGRGYPPELK